MATPMEQYIPDEFRETIDLPQAAPIDQAEVDRRQADILRHKNKAAVATKTIKALETQLKKKGLTAAQRTQVQKNLDSARKAIQTATIDQGTAQNLLYQAQGQYDKLLTGENRDAFMALQTIFNGYGLGSLAGKIYDFVKQGYGADTIGMLLQDTAEYKSRFAGNEARRKAGLAVLSPADYLSTEAAYRQVLSSAGMPKGFYDNPADFTRWIADDVSPTEIKSRVDLATAATGQANPEYKNALFQMYGINESDLTAYFLDRKRAEPILKKQAAAGAIGAAALRRGFAANTLDLEGYATLGITSDQAEQAYAQISSGFETMLGLAGRYGASWSQQKAEQEVFTPGASSGGQEAASDTGKRLRSQERALFAGSKGSSIQGLNAGYSQT